MKILVCVASIAVAMLALSGCKVLESPAAQPFDQAAVAVGVDTIVGVNSITKAARAAAIYKIAAEVLAADTGTVATLDQILSVVSAKITVLNLPPGDQAAANLLLAVLEAAINTYVGNLTGGATVQNIQASVAVVCKWVMAEAARDGGA